MPGYLENKLLLNQPVTIEKYKCRKQADNAEY